MFDFPDWSDLGSMGHLSTQTTFSWDHQLSQCERYRYYFDGDVFTETVPQERGNEEEEPALMYPVGLNLVKMLTVAQADATFGEWETNPVRFGTRPDRDVSDADIAAIDLIHQILEGSNAQSQLWEHELDRQVYGGGAIKISPALKSPGHIRWSRIPRYAFFPIWDPDDPDDLMEVFVVVAMSKDQAKAKYGYEASGDIVRRVEHWTKRKYENYLDGHKLTEYSNINPWGVVPFVYTPRYRFSNFWGDPLTPDIMDVQDELNMRIADIGEAINYNAHPVRTGINLPREFNAKNYPLGPNAMWNLGRVLQGQPEPKVQLLEAQHAVAPGVLEHVKFLYDWSRTSVFAPPIAFGEDNGGGQRSGTTLEVRMMPLIKSVRRSRSYLTAGMRRALFITATILEQKKIQGVSSRAIKSMMDGNIVPQYASLLPRDQGSAVDEVVKLLSTSPPSISLETAQKILGRGSGEVERIRQFLGDEELWARQMALALKAGADKDEKDKEEKKPSDQARVPNR